jgi:hypothetical protein
MLFTGDTHGCKGNKMDLGEALSRDALGESVVCEGSVQQLMHEYAFSRKEAVTYMWEFEQKNKEAIDKFWRVE